ncbi:MAG: tyrosine-type recombinase/integrase [Salinibacter sp.]|uniref:tyrosine-type recombinase/integrase n=1 Tax=Salinibacter sp. TaxID=2065818 RepID=UPI0035D518AB
MATFRKKDGEKYYSIRFYDPDRSPKRKEFSLRITRKSAARKETNRLEEKWENGEYDPWKDGAPSENLNVAEAVEEFLDDKQGTVRDNTHDTYEQQLEAWVEETTPGLMLQDVMEEHLRPYLFQADTSRATKRKRYRHLRLFFNWAEEQDHIDESPLGGIDQPKKQEKKPEYLTPSQVDTLLSTIDEHAENTEDAVGRSPDVQWIKDAIRIAVSTGLRRGELFNLRWSDVDLESRMLFVRNREGDEEGQEFTSKSGHEKAVPIRGDAEEVLNRRVDEGKRERTTYVLTNRNDEAIEPNTLTQRFKFFIRKADLDDKERLSLHSLRDTAGTWLAMQGVPQRIIQEILGHSSSSVTEKYMHAHPEFMGQAMEETFGS